MKISKKAFLDYQTCPSKAQLTLNQPKQKLTESESFRIQQGREIEALAQGRFYGGIKIQGESFSETCIKTATTLKLLPYATLFEASFETDNFRARADILVPGELGYHLIEVKSKTDKTKDVHQLHADAAYTTLVLQQSGLPVTKVSVWIISKDYRLGMPPGSLFTEWDVTAESLALIESWSLELDAIISACQNGFPATAGERCRSCEFFKKNCIGEGVTNHVLNIPGLRGPKLDALLSEGIQAIHDVPKDAALTKKQAIVVESVQRNQPSITGDLSSRLAQLTWPLKFLDFETVSTALPLYPAVEPWEQVVCQFSIHKLNERGQLHHAEFLANPEKECRRELALRLLEELGTDGSVIVYSQFERVTLQTLARLHPDLSEPLNDCIDRFVDLLAVIRTHYYQPEFSGSFSIKRVLPAMLPEFSYDDLVIANGDAAITRFARMARKELLPTEIKQAQDELLAYCQRDTFAMVLLLDRLFEIAGHKNILMEDAA